MLKSKKISLIIPAKNEEKSLPKLLSSVPSFVDEVIVVDNGSTDDTCKIAKKYGATVLSEPRKDKSGIGYGYAHIKGIKNASGDVLIAMDADGTYPTWQIGSAIEYMNNNDLDFVSCNRFPLKNKKAISRIRQFGVWVLNKETQLLFGYPMHDILTGMWVMNKKAAKALNLSSGGWNLSPEIKLKAIKNSQIKFSQYHIDHKVRVGESKQQIWLTGTNHFLYIAWLWLGLELSAIKAKLAKPLAYAGA